jgi:cell division protein FtsB
LQNENYNLQKEITKLTKEYEKYERENEILKAKIQKLDKQIYRNPNGPMKKFLGKLMP